MPEALATDSTVSDSSGTYMVRSPYQDLLSEKLPGGLNRGFAPDLGLKAGFYWGRHPAPEIEIDSDQPLTRVGQIAAILEPQDCLMELREDTLDHVKSLTLISECQEDWMVFRRFVEQWKAERGVLSSITQSALCPAYQSIIGMGRRAVPLILQRLRAEGKDPDQWFWALEVITGEQAVNDEDRGNYMKMAQAWLDWGERKENDW